MNSRTLFRVLAVILVLALFVSWRSARSWQPHIVKFAPAPSGQALAFNRDRRNDFFWRANGFTLCGPHSPAMPDSARNWNGADITLRSLRADGCDLDGAGTLAARRGANSDDYQWQLWNVKSAAPTPATQTLQQATGEAEFGTKALAISLDGAQLAGSLVSPRGKFPLTVLISDAQTGKPRARFVIPKRDEKGHSNVVEIWALAWAPDNRQLAVVGSNRLWIVDSANGKLLRSWSKDNIAASRARWSPNGKYLCVDNVYITQLFGDSNAKAKSADNSSAYDWYAAINLTIFEARTGKPYFGWAPGPTPPSQTLGVTNFDFSPDSAQLVWGNRNGTVLSVDLATRAVGTPYELSALEQPAPSQTTKTALDKPSYVAFAPDGNTLAVVSSGQISLWRVK